MGVIARLRPYTAALDDLPVMARLALVSVLSITAALCFTYTFTRIRYRSQLQLFKTKQPAKTTEDPPQIPYSIPWLGHAAQFLAPRPGQFFSQIFSNHPKETGAYTLLLGGDTSHILFDPFAIEALFRIRKLNRDKFNDRIIQTSLGLSSSELAKLRGFGEAPQLDENGREVSIRDRHDGFFHEFLLNQSCANELSRQMSIQMREYYAEERLKCASGIREVAIVPWLRNLMFKGSVDSLFGLGLVKVYPEIVENYWKYDETMLSLFFNVPKFVDPNPYENLDSNIDGLKKWRTAMLERSNNEVADPRTTAWEPIFGSRVNRVRQLFYQERKLSDNSAAALDLGFMFGIVSNSIPCTIWMLLHLLDPNGDRTLLPRIVEEIKTARLPDGDGLDVGKLTSLPLLQSVFSETLRKYSDLLVTRGLDSDLVLPTSEGQRQLRFGKGTTLMVPSWIAHHAADQWSNPEEFNPGRFIEKDQSTGAPTFSNTGAAGKYFPWGGGKTICPGRVFAKQEVFITLAIALLEFDFNFIKFIDKNGKDDVQFPCIRPAYTGTGVMQMEGDMVVSISNREA